MFVRNSVNAELVSRKSVKNNSKVLITLIKGLLKAFPITALVLCAESFI
jgi:hypothetical protein